MQKEISAHRFDKSAFGYKADEVDAYLNEIAAVVNELNAQNVELQNKLEILATKLEEYRQDENSMKEALVGAQRLGNNILKEAREKANEIIEQAQTKGDTIIREATESSQKNLSAVKKILKKNNTPCCLHSVRFQISNRNFWRYIKLIWIPLPRSLK